MRKTIRRLAAWACCLCMAAGAVTAAWAQETDYAQMERELVEAQRQQLTDGEPLLTRQDVLPAGQSSVADWYAIAMARCGIGEDYETYLAALKAYVESAYAENGGLSANKATEWHRVALAVTALIACGIVYLMTKNGFVSLILAAVLEAGLIGAYLWNSSRFEGLFPQIISQLSLFARFYTIVNGVFDVTAIVYYLSVTGFFLFLSVQSLEKRRWSE